MKDIEDIVNKLNHISKQLKESENTVRIYKEKAAQKNDDAKKASDSLGEKQAHIDALRSRIADLEFEYQKVSIERNKLRDIIASIASEFDE